MQQPKEEPTSYVGIVVGVLAVVGCGAAMFGVKVWYDKKKLGNSNPKRAQAYNLEEVENLDGQHAPVPSGGNLVSQGKDASSSDFDALGG